MPEPTEPESPVGTEEGPPKPAPSVPEPKDFVRARERAQEAEARAAELTAELERIRTEKAEAEAAKLAEQGEFKTLHEAASAELTATKTRLAELEARESTRLAAVKVRNTTDMETLSEEQQAEVKALTGEDASPDLVRRVIDSVQRLTGTTTVQPVVPGGGRGGGKHLNPDQLTAEEKSEIDALVEMGNVQILNASPSVQRSMAQARIKARTRT